MTRVIFFMMFAALTGCVTITPREATQANVPTSKPTAVAFKSLIQALVSNGYTVKTANSDAGLIITEPKGFNIPRGVLNIVWPARTTVQILLAEKSAAVTMTHECGNGDLRFGTGNWQHCNSQDDEANAVIPGRETEVLNLMKKAL